MRRIGTASVPIALFIAAFTGIVLALQASYTFTGAVPLYFVGTLVGKTIMLELGPVLTGLALAGRVGANVAAAQGLVVPRVMAATLMFPFVVVLAMAMGVLSGWLTAINLLDLSTAEFVRGLKLFYRFKDVWFGLVKSASFGLTIALVGCLKGLSATRGAEAVGRATTDAVVVSAMLILVLDAFWAVLLL